MRVKVLAATVCLLVASICPAQPGATGGEFTSPSIGSNPVDNRSLLAGDLGVVCIVSPHDTIPACSCVPLIARIANFGDEAVEVWFAYFWLVDPQGVRLFSRDTCLLMRVPAHESIDVRFGYFNVGLDTGQWVATCWFPSGDTNPQNDSLSDAFWVHPLRHWVVPERIIAPTDTIDSGAAVTPTARVVNAGPSPETFWAWFRIRDSGSVRTYFESTQVMIGVHDSLDVQFTPDVQCTVLGQFVTMCSTWTDTWQLQHVEWDTFWVVRRAGVGVPPVCWTPGKVRVA